MKSLLLIFVVVFVVVLSNSVNSLVDKLHYEKTAEQLRHEAIHLVVTREEAVEEIETCLGRLIFFQKELGDEKEWTPRKREVVDRLIEFNRSRIEVLKKQHSLE